MSHVDLNLLIGLDALLEYRSVQDAAAHLHLTPPAVSRILGRVRTATGDPILVRNGREMVPTARALELRTEVRELVARAQTVLAPGGELDLAHLSRTFTIRCHDALLTSLAPGLLAAITREAPHITLRLIAENPDDDRDLSRGDLDIDVGSPPAGAPSITTQLIGKDEMMLVVRRGSELDLAQPTAAQIADALHIVVSRRGRERGPVDEQLEALGLTRRVLATVPTVSAALAVVAKSSAVTILPHSLRDPLPQGLKEIPLPFPLTSAPVAVSWHHRHDSDRAHAWLRELVTLTISATLGSKDLTRAVVPAT